ncbi:MAG: hypothetical protein WCE82_06440 [Halobacteriota archaeon]
MPFWDIAFKVIELHPYSKAISYALTDYSDFDEGCLPTEEETNSRCEEIARRQNDPETPRVAHQWLSQLADYLCGTGEKKR